MSDHQRLLDTANEAVNLALPYFDKAPQQMELTAKGDRDYASTADYEIERAVRSFLKASTPDIGFLGEEEGQTGNVDRTWCLDPIDGTVNFVHQHPLCGVSLALIEAGQPAVGVLAFPWLQQRYQAWLGGGATCDGNAIRSSGETAIHDAVVAVGDYAVGIDAEARNDQHLALTDRLARRALRVRMHGSAAIDLAWLADGKIDASVTLSNNPWDVSAGVLIAREAGASVVGLDGETHDTDSKATIGASQQLVDELLALVRSPATN